MDTSINAGVYPTDMPALKVIVDGKPATFVQLGTSAKQVTLASGLTTLRHTVLVYAILGGGGSNNGWSATNAQLHIRSLQFDSGATLSSYPVIRRKNCLIYGDSFLTGYSGKTYNSGTTPFYTVADPSLSWAVQLGQALGCEAGVVAIGGSGYLQPGGLGFPRYLAIGTIMTRSTPGACCRRPTIPSARLASTTIALPIIAEPSRRRKLRRLCGIG